MSVVRDPMKDAEPPGASGISLAAVLLVPLGLVVIFAGLCLGLWVVSLAYNMLYHPDQVPLVSKVLDLIQEDDVVFQAVQEKGTTRFEGAGVRYGILLALLLVVFFAIGGVIKAFLTGGKAIIDVGLGRKPDEPKRK
jgi:hypothetical protein